MQKYPKGLFYLFVTEMWERFSFYGISAILVLYLTKGLHQAGASLTSGTFMAFTFMSPILGGFVADKVLGLRYSVTTGAILILIGNLILAFGYGITGLYVGLVCVALGTGYLKATVSVMVGKLYQEGDTHRDSGYTLFYMGINVGALLAGILVAYVGEKYGWTKGFYLSSAGMLFGLVVFQLGYKHYNNEADGFRRENLFRSPLGVPNLALIVLGTIALGAAMVFLFRHPDLTKQVITTLSLGILIGIFVLALSCTDQKERNSIFAILIIIVTAICFQSFFKQLYNSVPLFVDYDLNTKMLGYVVPSSSFALVPNSGAVILFAGVLTWMWAQLADKGRNPSIPAKMAIALCFAVVSSALLAWTASQIAATGVKLSAWWVVLAIVILTLGELNILPMGLSAMSALAPPRYASFLMGSWFLCNSLGSFFSGLLTNQFTKSLDNMDAAAKAKLTVTAPMFGSLYSRCSAALLVVTAVLFVLVPRIKKLMEK